MDNYTKIVQDNLDRLYDDLPKILAANLGGQQDGKHYIFDAFGEKCVVSPNRITLGGREIHSVLGILITLYALNTSSDVCIPFPLKSFKEFPDSAPYAGAFSTHTEQVLIPHVTEIKEQMHKIIQPLGGEQSLSGVGGDFSFIVYPLPKVALGYIFYEADDDFPASVTCLYSNNANQFMPIDGLADVGEYTSRLIITMIDG